MASVLPNPINLNNATRLPPVHTRTLSRSRSPSKSPTRKAQFAARELDPLLQSLSPDATLEALQKTNTIAGSQEEQTALAKSISDASESERKLGIRGAIAAKNLRQWTDEVSAWPWPSREDRAWGAGFVPPKRDESNSTPYCGSLPKTLVKQYEDRLDEIWDAIETLGMDDLKDYVFSSHNPRTSSAQPLRSYPSSYGRMRDFTALITAIVIQSLPVQANLLIMLDTWSIRLSILREVPDLLLRFDQVKRALNEIRTIIHDPTISPKLTKGELETAKVMFGNKVSYLCKRVDALLDQLEGQQDSLPQAWLDSLDDIENKYAEWVVQAEQVVLKNQMLKNSPRIKTDHKDAATAPNLGSPQAQTSTSLSTAEQPIKSLETSDLASPAPPESSVLPESSTVKRKPLLEVNPKAYQKHQRGFSDASAAESTFSGYSLENAEIVEAVETKMMPSPRISVIDHQSSPIKTPASWLRGSAASGLSPPRPGVQRAATASIEVVPKEHVKEVVLRRSASHDLLSSSSNLSRRSLDPAILLAVNDPTIISSETGKNPSSAPKGFSLDVQTSAATSPSPSLMVDPLNLRGKELSKSGIGAPPSVPRRSSKRLSLPLLDRFSIPSLLPEAKPAENNIIPNNDETYQSSAPLVEVKRQETFDDKLKSILASMPTKIKLTAGSDSGMSSGSSSESSTRASSPLQTLKLSPVRDSKSGRYHSTSGIRVYNLSKTGKSRDIQPIKLFVRAVGEHGDRVMVRVGGGWADLGEYLREYSLHHGGRGLTERRLEVAGYPRGKTSNKHGSPSSSTILSRASPSPHPVADVASTDAAFNFDLPDINLPIEVGKEIKPTSHLSQSPGGPQRPPPVPIVPKSRSPAVNTPVTSPRNQLTPRSSTPSNVSRPSSRVSVHTSIGPTITSTTSSTNNYTPLGAAGPVQNNRRSASHTYNRIPQNQEWVNGMMNQARAVSGSHATASQSTNAIPVGNRNSTIITSPTTTTTTTIMSSRVRNSNSGSTSRRISAMLSPSTPTPTGTATTSNYGTPRPNLPTSPVGSQVSKGSSGSNNSFATANTNTSKSKNAEGEGRRRSMMSFGDVGGIRRVFLRKKSEK